MLLRHVSALAQLASTKKTPLNSSPTGLSALVDEGRNTCVIVVGRRLGCASRHGEKQPKGLVVELVQEHVRRALAYLRLLNDQGVDPAREHVETFASSPGPRDAVYESALFTPISSAMLDLTRPRKVRDAEPVVDFLLRLEWVQEPESKSGHLRLTDLGRTLLRGLEAEAPALPQPTVADIVLEPTDPLAWVHLTRVVASAGPGMLVDAYFKAEFVQWLVETTTIQRLLISSRHSGAVADLARMAVALATVPNTKALQVRSTKDPELHDRCIIGADSRLQLLGASVNGVGRSMTAVITPDDKVMRVYRERYENLWSKATAIDPQQPGAAVLPALGASGPSSPSKPRTRP